MLAIVKPTDIAALTSIIRVNDTDEFVGRGRYPHSGITFVSLVPVQQMLEEFEGRVCMYVCAHARAKSSLCFFSHLTKAKSEK